MKFPTPNDVIRVSRDQIDAMLALPDTIALLNRSLTSFAQTVARLEHLAQRLDRLTEPLEAPLAALAPRLDALVAVIDNDLVGSLPAVLESLQRTAIPALEVMAQAQAQVATMAASVEKLATIVDDAFSRLPELPGAALVGRLRDNLSPKSTSDPTPTPAAPTAPPAKAASPARRGKTTEEHRSWRG